MSTENNAPPGEPLRASAPILTQVRREPIDFRAIAAEAGCTCGTLCHSPAWGWGVRPADSKPADFCIITPPRLQEGEIELRISADERHWVFMGYVTPNTTVSNPGRQPTL